MVTIIDYGVGNINAFVNVYSRLNIITKIAKVSSDLDDAEKLILPGVGAFDYAMTSLNNSGMRQKLEDLVLNSKVPILGVCVGMQMMGLKSEEGISEGLKWIDGENVKFDSEKIKFATKLPHMGWNDVEKSINNPLFQGLEIDSIFYFLHSYYFKCNNLNNIIAESEYGGYFTSAFQKENIFGIQFHPEKSHGYGEKILENFAKL